MMDIFLIIIGALLLIIGFCGCILPIIPGLPLSYIGLLLLQLTDKVKFSTTFLLVWLAIVVVVQVLDFMIPAISTKRSGGSKKGTWGSMLGLLLGTSFGTGGVILGPIAGAFIGEKIDGKETTQAAKAALGSFIGFIIMTTIKVLVAAVMIYYFISALF